MNKDKLNIQEIKAELIKSLRSVTQDCEKVIDQSYDVRPYVLWKEDVDLIELGFYSQGAYALLPVELHFPNGNVRSEYDLALRLSTHGWIGTGYSAENEYSVDIIRSWAEAICPLICNSNWEYLQKISGSDNSKRLSSIEELINEF